MFPSLRSWWRRRPRPPLEPLQIVMYTRQGCHLCDAAWQLLEAEQPRYRFRLSAVDVDSDPVLAERFGHEVPVVAVDGRVRFRGLINKVLLERLLRAEVGRKKTST